MLFVIWMVLMETLQSPIVLVFLAFFSGFQIFRFSFLFHIQFFSFQQALFYFHNKLVSNRGEKFIRTKFTTLFVRTVLLFWTKVSNVIWSYCQSFPCLLLYLLESNIHSHSLMKALEITVQSTWASFQHKS